MGVRTDLATEFAADRQSHKKGIKIEKYDIGGINASKVKVLTDGAALEIGKPKGCYITLESDKRLNIFDNENLRNIIVEELKNLLGDIKSVLVVGVGNDTVTPDALGPKVAGKVLATRHISLELAEKIGLKGLKQVSVLSPGVLGQTGIELKEIIDSTAKTLNPSVIILIDALAAREVSRLGSTVQLSNTGISPGSGVGNMRAEISEKTVGVKCITIGVPTVVDAWTLCYDLAGVESAEHEQMVVTPRDIDRLIEHSSKIISEAINIALQPEIDPDILLSVV